MKKESATWKAWPTGKKGHGLHPAKYHQLTLVMVLTGVWTKQMQRGLLGMLCAIALVIRCWCCTCETSSVEVDAGLRARRMPGRACLGSGCRGSRDLHLKSGEVLQPCGRGHKIGTNCMLGSCAGPCRRTLQRNLGLLLI